MTDQRDLGRPSDDGVLARGVYDWASTSPSRAIVERVAAAAGRDQTDIAPLYEYVDPDGLDVLVGSDGRADVELVVSFAMEDYHVTVHGDGRVIVRSRGTVE